VARGPKPLAVLRELQIVPWAVVPEPNTWRELLEALDAKGEPLRGARVAVQEYGRENPELIEGLEARGAVVTRVRVYRYALPEDTQPLQDAADAVARGDLDVVLFTTSAQVTHLEYVAESQGVLEQLKAGLRRMVVASIGPTTSEELRHEGLEIDLEASHPKMGFLVREAAEKTPDILRGKR
jgi:uroporphyrinogen-III synthase